MGAVHTPGPWWVQTRDDLKALGCSDDHLAEMGLDEGYVSISGVGWRAFARACVVFEDAPSSEGEANARLIAAAPGLLRANNEALTTLTDLRADLAEADAALHAQRIAVINLAIDLLATARGKAMGGLPCHPRLPNRVAE